MSDKNDLTTPPDSGSPGQPTGYTPELVLPSEYYEEADAAADDPSWTIVEQTDTTPIDADGDGRFDGIAIRTVRTAERVRIIQLPRVLADDDERSAAELAAEALASASGGQVMGDQVVNTTTTVYDEQGEPLAPEEPYNKGSSVTEPLQIETVRRSDERSEDVVSPTESTHSYVIISKKETELDNDGSPLSPTSITVLSGDECPPEEEGEERSKQKKKKKHFLSKIEQQIDKGVMKLENILKKSNASYGDSMSKEKYEGEVESVEKTAELTSEPIRDHVNVYHSGCSDRASTSGQPVLLHKTTSEENIFDSPVRHDEKTHSHLIVTDQYEGPVYVVPLNEELNKEPIDDYVAVYHSGQSGQEEHETTKEPLQQSKPKKEKRGVGSFLFKSNVKKDYPTEEKYQGPMQSTTKNTDIEETPINNYVNVYHSGASYDQKPQSSKISSRTEETAIDEQMKTKPAVTDVGFKVSSFFKRTGAHENYPTSEYYEGPVETVPIYHDMDSLPLTEHAQVYHSGRSDEEGPSILDKASDKLEDAKDKATGAIADLGSKVSGFFKKTGTYDVNPETNSNEGAVQTVVIQRDVESLPTTDEIIVEERIRTHDEGPGILDRASDKLEHAKDKAADKVAGLGAKVSGFFKKSAAHDDYPKSVYYEGPVETIIVHRDVDSTPLTEHVQVYHSGRSDEEGPGILDRASDKLEDAKDKASGAMAGLGSKVSGFFKRSAAHDDYPKSEYYEGPVESVTIHREVDALPLTEHVQVYHSGRSDEEGPGILNRASDKLEDAKDKATGAMADLGSKVSGFFKRSAAHDDYPKSEYYEGSVDTVTIHRDVESTPLTEHVQVYHSGRSDEEGPGYLAQASDKLVDATERASDAMADLGSKVSGFFKKSAAHDDYPKSEYYEGHLETTEINREVDTLPLTEHVQVYHSGRSDEEGPSILDKASDKLEDAKDKATGAIADLGSKVSGFFKKTGTYEVNPETDNNDGAVQTVVIQRDVEYQPISENIVIEESVRTHEDGPGFLDKASDKLEHAKDKAADAVAGLGAKVSGLFKRSAAHDDYPKSEYYEGPMETVTVQRDVDAFPLTEHVQVYHSGRSDEEGPGVLDIASDKLEEAKDKASGAMAELGSKVSGFFKKSAAHDDYPKSEFHEGPVETVIVHRDVDTMPLTEHVQVYHSGRSDEEGPGYLAKASDKMVDATERASDAMAELGSKVSGFFKKSTAHDDYPKSEYYEGPVETIVVNRDVDTMPLTEHVQVYHSGRSDEEGPGILDRASEKLEDAKDKAAGAMAGLGSKVSGFFKKSAAHDDYPKSEYYEGQVETITIYRDVDAVPINEHVQVYHSGRSDEDGPGVLDRASDKLEEAKDRASGAMADLGSKVSGFFKRSAAHDDYPKSEYYDGSVDTVTIHRDVDSTPLTEHVQVYHSGRSDEEGPGYLAKASDKFVDATERASDAMADLGSKVSGFFKKSAAHDDYPKSDYYEGPVEIITVHHEVDALPLTEHVQVYHSGRSDEDGPGILDRASDKLDDAKDKASGAMAGLGSKVSGFFKKSATYEVNPEIDSAERPVETVLIRHEVVSLPMTENVLVEHNVRSDDSEPGSLDRASNTLEDAKGKGSSALAGFSSKVSGFFKRSVAHDDYPKSPLYEGPVENIIVNREVEALPLTDYVQVYHSGRSDEAGPGIFHQASDKIEDAKDKASGAMSDLGSKVSGFFKKSAAHDDYPKTEYYDGPVGTIEINRQLDILPLTEHVQVYHSGRSDEEGPGIFDRASDKLEDANDKASGAMADLGTKVSGFFKKSPAHEDYPKSEYYEGPIETAVVYREVDALPITEHVQVYHSGRSDEEGPGILDRAADKLEDAKDKASGAMAGLGTKVSGFFKRSAAHDDYPLSEYFEGPVETIVVQRDVEPLPLLEHVQVYHSGRSDEEGPGILDRASDKLEDAKDRASGAMADLGSKVSGFFKRSTAHEDYPKSEYYEGPVETVIIHREVDALPLTEHVQVYHSGRSDEEGPGYLAKASDKLVDATERASDAMAGLGSKVSGFFKRSAAHDDYPKSEYYEGPVETVIVQRDTDAFPLTEHVQVYHSGRSDEEGPGILDRASNKLDDAKDKAAGAMAGLGSKVSGFFKKSPAHEDYPKSEYYDGQVEIVTVQRDVDALPLTEHVHVYHSGRSDEEGPGYLAKASDKMVDATERASDAMADLGSKVSGFFKRSVAHDDYPKSEYYEGPVETVIIHREVDALPLTEHVQVYHSGRSDEEGPGYLAKASDKMVDATERASDAMAGLGSKVSGFFKRSAAHDDYPKTEYYEGSVEIVTVSRDVDSIPLTEHVQVYHSGRSDEEGAGILERASDKLVDAKEKATGSIAELGSKVSGFFKKSAADEEGAGILERASDKLVDAKEKATGSIAELGSKVSGFFKKSAAHEDYPKSEYYEGPVETVIIHREVDSMPLTEHVQVYHSGRSDEEGPGYLAKASDKLVDATERASDAMAGLGSKVSGFFKKSAAHDDYPKTEYYDGPVETIEINRQLDILPLTEHVQVYHSGRSDEEGPGILDRASDKLEDAKEKASGAMAGLGSKVSGFFKKSTAHDDYPISEFYEGQVETVIVHRDVDSMPLTEYVQVYHSGRSDEEGPGILDRASDKLEDAKDKAAGAMVGLGSKVSGFFKKSTAHDDYPKSTYYDGPVERIEINREVDALPLIEHVQVYHSGRSDEEGPGILDKASDKLEDAKEKASGAMTGLGSKVSGFFKKSPAHDDYPKSSFYEGPVETVSIYREADSMPITEYVEVYHSGRSDEEGPGILGRATDKLEHAKDKASAKIGGIGSKVSSFFKKSDTYEVNPESDLIEKPVSTVIIHHEVVSLPMTENVLVEQIIQSENDGQGTLDRQPEKLEDVKHKPSSGMAGLGSKVSGFFKKSAAHEDYPKSTVYEGEIETVEITRDVEALPITEHVQVYHSGRSDEEGPGILDRASDKLEDAKAKASGAMTGFGSKMSGFFKKGAAHDDYPKSEHYEGPLETVIVHRDINAMPLTEHVQVYHSGRSDEEGPGILN
uniref:Uncharacterized protein n=1 Tax=Plectus sambesii TaxID=2011161 RepID=A0A914VJC4_9BILA